MNERFPGHFSPAQTLQLLSPIKPHRVLKDGKGMSHVSQQDITAHLIRVFGFGNFATELLDTTLIDATCRNPDDTEYKARKWDVTYRATMRLTIFDEHHNFVAQYEDASCGDAQNQVLHDAHDLALKSAISLAKKRCAINLGDQFGLSLYNKGQMQALVGGTHVLPPKPEDEKVESKDLQEDVPPQVSMGHDEIEKRTEATEEQEAQLAASLGATKVEEHPPTDEERQALAGEESQEGPLSEAGETMAGRDA